MQMNLVRHLVRILSYQTKNDAISKHTDSVNLIFLYIVLEIAVSKL